MAVAFITRLLTQILGYAYPAYGCYKTLELNKPQIDQLRFWCQYWILLAFLTTLERISDSTVSWLPLYGEAKLALVLYLWYPKTRGAVHVYESYLQPLLARHEADIDRGLLELRARAKDATASHLHAAVSFGRACFADVAGRVSSQLQPPGNKSRRPRRAAGRAHLKFVGFVNENDQNLNARQYRCRNERRLIRRRKKKTRTRRFARRGDGDRPRQEWMN